MTSSKSNKIGLAGEMRVMSELLLRGQHDIMLFGGTRVCVWLVTLKQSSPPELFSVQLTRSRREAYTSFVKERFVNQNGGMGPAR